MIAAPQHQPDTEDNLDLAVWRAMGGVVLSECDTIPNDPHLYFSGGFWRVANDHGNERWQPTANWAQLGPLIERFGVSLSRQTKTEANPQPNWTAFIDYPSGYEGQTAAIAACRAIAATYTAKLAHDAAEAAAKAKINDHHAEMRAKARALRDGGMQCNCDLDRWQPEERTGHSWVCRIHKAVISGEAKND